MIGTDAIKQLFSREELPFGHLPDWDKRPFVAALGTTLVDPEVFKCFETEVAKLAFERLPFDRDLAVQSIDRGLCINDSQLLTLISSPETCRHVHESVRVSLMKGLPLHVFWINCLRMRSMQMAAEADEKEEFASASLNLRRAWDTE